MMARGFALCALLGLAAAGAASPAAARDDTCLAALQAEAQACTDDCVNKAKAAVDPEIRDRVLGRACAKNCLKIQMFQGRRCE